MNIRQHSKLHLILCLSLRSAVFCSPLGVGQGGSATNGRGFVNTPPPAHNETKFALKREDEPCYISDTSQTNSSAAGGLVLLGSSVISKHFVDVALSGVQFGLCFYIAKAIWKAIVELVEEFEIDSLSAGNFVPDDHDTPLFTEEGVNIAAGSLVNNHQSDDGVAGRNKNESPAKLDEKAVMGKMPQKFGFASNLALRLHHAGLPALSNPGPEGSPALKSVQSVMKSLTRTEGRLLSNTLLSPLDDDSANQDASSREERLIKMWEDIGGLDDVKEGLMDLVFPLMQKNHIEDDAPASKPSYYGGLLDNPPGVLLYGPPGCGKTMLVSALAGTVNARFLTVSPSTLFRKYVGETNINVKALFTLARKISPCIIFVDEMEGLFRERRSSGSEEHEVSRELKTEFMQLWDGIQRTNDGIIIVGATNRPFDVDSAFLRRMPRSFFVGLPNYNERRKILSSILTNVPLDRDFNLDQIAQITENYTPSDMKEVLRTSALFPLREARADILRRREAGHKLSSSECLAPELRSLTTQDVIFSLQKVSPTPLTNEYQTALSAFASKASGRAMPFEQAFNVQDADNLYRMPNNQNQGNQNDYYVANVNPSTAVVENFENHEESEFEDDESYQDSCDDSSY